MFSNYIFKKNFDWGAKYDVTIFRFFRLFQVYYDNFISYDKVDELKYLDFIDIIEAITNHTHKKYIYVYTSRKPGLRPEFLASFFLAFLLKVKKRTWLRLVSLPNFIFYLPYIRGVNKS